MVLISYIVVQGLQMAVVLLLAPLLTGFVRKVKARLLRRRGAFLYLSPTATSCAYCARRWSWLKRLMAVPGHALPDLRHHLGCRRAHSDLCNWSSIQLDGRSHRDYCAPGRGLFLALRLGMEMLGHQLRRHRVEPRNDDRDAGRAGNAAD